MRITIFAALLLLATPALAQQAPPQFVPYSVSQDDHAKIMTYLGEQPAKIAIPLIQALSQLEQKAIEEKAKAEISPKENKN